MLSLWLEYLEDGKRRDAEIGRQLKQWHRAEERVVKLLLLGTGESGKSTITKQMRIIHIDGFSESEKREQIPDIKRNIRDAILILLGAMRNLGIPLENEQHQTAADYIMREAIRPDFEEDEVFYDHVTLLWSNKGIQDCYHRSNEYQLFDSAKYFLDKVHVVRKDSYLPSEQDILRCRVMTNTIKKIDFVAMDGRSQVNFSVFDVGGQQGERRKWISVFDMTTAILFVVDCSCFDQTLRENTNKNRFLEALEIFEQVWNNRYLRQVPVMLFLNKIDLLEEKVNQGRSLDMLIDSMSSSNKYYKLLEEFKTFTKYRDSERKEVVEAFPRFDPAASASSTSSTSEEIERPRASRLGRKKSSLPPIYREDLDDEVVRTAVFIKRVFMQLVHKPINYELPDSWHEKHSCEYYFTCAVDTQTIKKVLEGCRCFIIRKVLDKWGM